MKILLIILVLLCGTMNNIVEASEIGILIGSKHHNHKPDGSNLNEINPGVYGVYKNVFAGVFKNSYSDTTYIAGYHWQHRVNNYFKFFAGIGLTYGYGWDSENHTPGEASLQGKKVLPYISPGISIGYNGINLNTHIMFDSVAWSISYEW